MKTQWNDGLGHRGRQVMCLLVPADGRVIKFVGAPIAGVCGAQEIDHTKNGKWSNSTWEITHAETTAVVPLQQQWETGRYFPQPTWEAGFFALAEKAPTLSREEFESFIRAEMPRHAERWDRARAAEAEFGFAATPEEVAAIEAAQERIAAEKAAYETEQQRRRAGSPFAKLAALKR